MLPFSPSHSEMYGSLSVTRPFHSSLHTCWLLPSYFQSGEAIISLSIQRGFHDPWEWWESLGVKGAYMRIFICAK